MELCMIYFNLISRKVDYKIVVKNFKIIKSLLKSSIPSSSRSGDTEKSGGGGVVRISVKLALHFET